ncbi:MAG: putative DNA binding domain-containing protein [Bacilli bacterium]|nr:putative DNA binding domain-containing protein [Bacilli bacterium]
MIEEELQNLKESNRFEGKLAGGGVPKSVWETYSSFANTFGGSILLGVEEDENRGFHYSPIKDPLPYVDNIWSTLNNTSKISKNILVEGDVKTIPVDGGYLIRIDVPKANRVDRPIYINGNVYGGCYKRNSSGDYHCTKEEVDSLIADSRTGLTDNTLIEELSLSDLCKESYDSYRTRLGGSHPFSTLDDADFLIRLGAARKSNDGIVHPTKAGLLFFGYEYAITSVFGNYFLDFQKKEDHDPASGYVKRIYSNDGYWPGNLYEYLFRVYEVFQSEISKPFKLKNGLEREDDSPLLIAVREALANAISNVDFLVGRNLGVYLYPDEIVFRNPGLMLVSVAQAKQGGESEPRNQTILKMLNLIHIGERAGSGIPRIDQCLSSIGLSECKIEQGVSPDFTSVSISLLTIGNPQTEKPDLPGLVWEKVDRFLREHVQTWTTMDFSQELGIPTNRASDTMKTLLKYGFIEIAPGYKIGKYRTVFHSAK